MPEMTVTLEQWDAIDEGIRQRVTKEQAPRSDPDFFPSSVLIMRTALGLGADLEFACPYFRDCDQHQMPRCHKDHYRQCSFYGLKIGLDVMAGRIAVPEIVTA